MAAQARIESEMDDFFAGIDVSLADSIKDQVPQATLSETIEKYEGGNSKEEHLRALVVILESQSSEQARSLGPKSEERKKTIEVLGLCHSALDNWTAAATTWQTIVDIDDKETLDNHPGRDLAAMFNLGLALNHLEQYPEAEQIFRRLLPMLEAEPHLGKTSQQYAGSLTALMLAVGKQGRVEDARKLYSEHGAIIKQFDEPAYNAHAEVSKAMLSGIEHEARER